MNNVINTEKGENGQWVVTCEYAGWFHSKQYYGYSKLESIAKAKNDRNFFKGC